VAKKLSILYFLMDYKQNKLNLNQKKKKKKKRHENSMMRLKQIHKHEFKGNQFG
jgi:hypothetical protein